MSNCKSYNGYNSVATFMYVVYGQESCFEPEQPAHACNDWACSTILGIVCMYVCTCLEIRECEN